MAEKNQEEVLVSVVIPAYRCAETIQKAINSALDQEVPVEVLVLNDCSPDDLDRVMEAYREEPRVWYLKNDQNLGASGTRNRAVKLARGQYTAFLDADDWWEKGKLKIPPFSMQMTGGKKEN